MSRASSPWSVAGSAAYAGFLHKIDMPEAWGQGAGAYGKRFASTAACSGIRAVLALGLDSTLHQDPRYFRAGELAAVARRSPLGVLGSAYGAAFLSNQ